MSVILKKEPKIAVAIPVFNAERYIYDCLLSLTKQRYDNFTVYLIDDGSVDLTVDIINRFVNDDERFKLFSQPNRGAANARNFGLQKIEEEGKFKYICFLDSDDVYQENYLETLLSLLKEGDADIAICGYYWFNEKGIIRDSLIPMEKKILKYADFVSLIFGMRNGAGRIGSGGYSWKHMFKASLINGLRFPEGKICEDEYFTLCAASNAQKFVYTYERLYGYRVHPDSMVRSKDFCEMLLKGRLLCLEIVKKKSVEATDLVILSIVTSLIDCYKKNYKCSVNVSYLKEEVLRVYKKRLISHKMYLRWLLILHFPNNVGKLFMVRDLCIKMLRK